MHFTLQLVLSLHAIVPLCTWILQVASVLHTTVAISPSLKSQFELALHVTWLLSPPLPLHSDVSLHVRVSASSVDPLHFEPLVHTSVHASAPQSVLQSVPAVHTHAVSAQTHPLPRQVGAEGSSPPHALVTNRAIKMGRMILSGASDLR